MAHEMPPDAVVRFYDRFGSRQDAQAFYEDAALDALVAASQLSTGSFLFELGCGTGRLAERLLEGELPTAARYLGVDVSATMIGLATRRLERFGTRAEVRRTEPVSALPAKDEACDRFLSTYVFDLLGEEKMSAALREAHRVLRPGGLLCVASLTRGPGLLSGIVSSAWRAIHAVRPMLVGGCRPIAVTPRLEPAQWTLRHSEVVTAWAVPSEVVVAERR